MATAVAVGLAVLGAPFLPAVAQEDAAPDAPTIPEITPSSPPPAVEAESAPVTPPPASAQRVGVIKAQNVNVRAKADLQSEIVVQLQQGDRVTILEEVPVAAPKKGEPATWLKIALPPASAAWVSGKFVDPSTGIVKADLLNVRGGPGEQFSVLGRIKQGTVVGIIEGKGDWIRIEPPLDAAAYVAAFLVSTQPGAVPVEVVVTAPLTTPTQPPPIEPATTDPTLAPEPIPVETIEIVEPVETDVPPEVDLVLVEDDMVEEELILPEPPPKRIVRREGIVLRSLSIQAPTSFVLQNLDSRRVINYLNAPSTNVVLLDFYGKRVVVSGEELLDERWMNTPVLNIESIEPVPVPVSEPGR